MTAIESHAKAAKTIDVIESIIDYLPLEQVNQEAVVQALSDIKRFIKVWRREEVQPNG